MEKKSLLLNNIISNKQELIFFLINENTSYSNYIKNLFEKNSLEYLKQTQTHRHHIIPLHMGGPDKDWNLINLSIEQHSYAHKLLFENYGNYFDLCASCMLLGQTNAGFEAIRKANQLKMKKNQVGFYNSELQRELGKRQKKKRKPYARNLYVKAALEKGIIIQWIQTNEIVIIEPFTYPSLVDVINYLMIYPQMVDKQQSWESCLKKEKYSAVTALTRILTGHIDKKTGKKLFSFMGWRVLGIFI